jgi:hypothetical protein
MLKRPSTSTSNSYAGAARKAIAEEWKVRSDGRQDQEKFVKINPKFQEGNNQLIVKPRFYNGRRFAGFVLHLEAKHMLYKQAMGLDCKNLHGIGFIRDLEDNLLIVFRLNKEVDLSSLRRVYEYSRFNKAGVKTG